MDKNKATSSKVKRSQKSVKKYEKVEHRAEPDKRITDGKPTGNPPKK